MIKRISMVLIDDNPSAGEGVIALIRTQKGFEIIAASAEIEDALRNVRQNRPDLVLVNLRRRDNDSLTLAGALHGESPKSRVIVMGMRPLHDDVASYVQAGVSGFVMADGSLARFLGTIRSVAQGIQVLPPELTRRLFGQISGPAIRKRWKPGLDLGRLTRRERSVTDLIVLGLSNREISTRLSIALHTVKGHVHRVLSKLALNSRLEVAAFSRDGRHPGPVSEGSVMAPDMINPEELR